MSCIVTMVLVLAAGLAAQPQPSTPPENPPIPVTYGNAAVQAICRIDADYTIFCDLADFPPVIGKEIPVCIRGLEHNHDNLSPLLLQFLQDTLLKTSNKPDPPSILLRDIQRGPTFCLIADVEVNGEDLGTLLVEKGLVRRVFQVPDAQSPEADPAPAAPSATRRPDPPQEPARPENPESGFVASRTGKVFHRPDCSHAKRISEDRKVRFSTRREAEASGRRPCKTCSP